MLVGFLVWLYWIALVMEWKGEKGGKGKDKGKEREMGKERNGRRGRK